MVPAEPRPQTQIVINRIGALVIAMLAAVAIGASAAHAATSVSVVFQSSGKVAFTGLTTVRFVGAGTSTPYGPIESRGVATITGLGLTCLVGLVNTNVETFTTSTGDALTITSKDLGCANGIATFHGLGHWTVTGGTGLFAGAQGSGVMEGDVSFLAGTFAIVATGTLDLASPAADN